MAAAHPTTNLMVENAKTQRDADKPVSAVGPPTSLGLLIATNVPPAVAMVHGPAPSRESSPTVATTLAVPANSSREVSNKET